MKRGILLTMAIIFTLSSLGWFVAKSVKENVFVFGCESYLKLAADASTIEMAKPQLDKAIKYLEDHNLTIGIVSVFFKNPTNDIGFFYRNLKAAQAELEKANPNITQLEESNLLMRLRKTLLEDGKSTVVTCPNGISVYPNNKVYFWWGIISLFFTIVFWLWCAKEY